MSSVAPFHSLLLELTLVFGFDKNGFFCTYSHTKQKAEHTQMHTYTCCVSHTHKHKYTVTNNILSCVFLLCFVFLIQKENHCMYITLIKCHHTIFLVWSVTISWLLKSISDCHHCFRDHISIMLFQLSLFIAPYCFFIYNKAYYIEVVQHLIVISIFLWLLLLVAILDRVV